MGTDDNRAATGTLTWIKTSEWNRLSGLASWQTLRGFAFVGAMLGRSVPTDGWLVAQGVYRPNPKPKSSLSSLLI
jgi:hypothetical protein